MPVYMTDHRPPEGWEYDARRHQWTFVMHERLHEKAPDFPGWEPYWVGVHGIEWTSWVYRPLKEED